MKNIANYISISRIIMSIILLVTKTLTLPFYIVYIYCGVSDILDGFISRKYNIQSELGSKLDSIADITFVFTALVKIIPFLKLSNYIYLWIIIIIIIKVFNIIFGYVYYKKIMFHHSIANKITGLILFISPLIILNIDSAIIVISICLVATFSAIQEGFYIKLKKI